MSKPLPAIYQVHEPDGRIHGNYRTRSIANLARIHPDSVVVIDPAESEIVEPEAPDAPPSPTDRRIIVITDYPRRGHGSRFCRHCRVKLATDINGFAIFTPDPDGDLVVLSVFSVDNRCFEVSAQYCPRP